MQTYSSENIHGISGKEALLEVAFSKKDPTIGVFR